MYLWLTESFKTELFICIKLYLALKNQQRLISCKTQTNKQTCQQGPHGAENSRKNRIHGSLLSETKVVGSL